MKFTIPANAIRAVELFAGKDDSRYYLNGIYVRALDRDTLQLVGTNGHIMGQYRHTRDPVADEPYQPDENYILPRELTTGMRLDKHVHCVQVTAHVEKWTVDYIGSQRSGKPIDAKYPDIGRIWPTSLTIAAAHFDFSLFAQIQSACRLLNVRGPVLYQNGMNSSFFTVGPQFAGIIMPWRQDATSIPDWCKVKIISVVSSPAKPKRVAAIA
jgi:hypothetical protein